MQSGLEDIAKMYTSLDEMKVVKVGRARARGVAVIAA